MIMPGASSPFHTMPEELAPSKNCFDGESMFMYDQPPATVKEEKPTYASMKPVVKSTQILSALSSQDDQSLTTWTNIYPEHWTTAHILDWLFYVALLHKHKIDLKKFGAEKFHNITGRELCSMNKEQFVERMPEYGHILYEELRVLLKEAEFEEPDMSLNESNVSLNEQTFTQINSYTDHCMVGTLGFQQEYFANVAEQDSTSAVLEMNRLVPMEQALSSSSFVIDGREYDYDPIGLKPEEDVPPPPQYDDGYITDYSESDPDGYYGDPYQAYPMQHYAPANWAADMSHVPATVPTKPKRAPGRPKRAPKNSESSEDDSEMAEGKTSAGSSHRGRRQGQSTKGSHLWEFVRDLLKNPDYNNKIIKWEDHKAGVFRFVHSDKVANLWGRKKNNLGMTYEKLSRAMRYYYKRGILERVDGRRLVYKFGKNATGWQED